MVDQAVLVRVLSDYARTLAGNYAIGDVLHDLVERVTEVVGVAGAGVSLAENGQIKFATAINDAIATIERVEEATQVGPCVDAHRSGDVVLVTDLRDDPLRWAAVAEAALDVGVIGVAGIPMHLDGTEVGALSLYASERRDWSPEEVSVARLLADMATAYVAHASALQQARRMSEQLQEALTSRVVIEQAKGMLAAERKISVDDAFEVLRAHARRHHASIRSVADAVVHLGLRP
jgi:GAF domain-containing protein